MPDTPPPSVLHGLGITGTGEPLPGGQGQAIRYDGLVLKPCENPRQWSGLAPLIASLTPVDYRVARPVQFKDGQWVAEGWMATEVLEGTPGYAGREGEALDACDAIHRDLRRVYASSVRPEWLASGDSCYDRADRIAWGDVSPGEHLDEDSCRVLEEVTRYLRPLIEPAQQITHGDPGGDNVLFSDHAPPAIIDISPYWRPAGYGIAMMLADGIAWEGSTPETLDLAADRADIGQLLLRAVLFRLAVSVLYSGPSQLDSKLRAYDPVIRWAIGRETAAE